MAAINCRKLSTIRNHIRTHRYSASMTVEASYVTAIVILMLAVLIQTAYFQCGKTTELMRLHCVVEQLCCREEEQIKALPHGQAERTSALVNGYIDMGIWRKEITVGLHEPEELLRKIGAFEKDEVQEENKE